MFFGFSFLAIGMAVVMLIALIAMIVCAKKQDTVPAAKPAAIACMVVVMVCALGILIQTGMFGDYSTSKIIANEMVYAKAGAYIPGKYIGEKFPGSKILFLVDDEKYNSRQKEIIESFKEGLAGKAEIIGSECPRPLPPAPTEEAIAAEGAATTPPIQQGPIDSMMMMPIQETMTAQVVNDIMLKYPKANMLVTFVGFPRDIENMDIWHEEDTEKMVKVAVVSGDIYQLKPAFARKQAAAVVAYSPKAKFDESKAPSDMQAAFDKRYLLITLENIESILTEYPGLFPEDKK
jgi:hypothetical protein